MSEKLLIVHCDGLVEPFNPGGHGCWGWVAIDPQQGDRILAQAYGYEGSGAGVTNNAMEYRAVIEALEWVKQHKSRWRPAGYRVELRTDSQLVAYQVMGRYRCNAPDLQRLYTDAIFLLAAAGATVTWVPREDNQLADALTRLAYQDALAGRLVAA